MEPTSIPTTLMESVTLFCSRIRNGSGQISTLPTDIAIDSNAEVISGSTPTKCKNRIGKPTHRINVAMVLFSTKPVIKELRRISKPSLRKYSSSVSLESVKNGLGSYILSTNQGLMTDRDARAKNVGGEILCEVF